MDVHTALPAEKTMHDPGCQGVEKAANVKRFGYVAAVVLQLLLLFCCAQASELLIAAASSLTDALTEMGGVYEKRTGEVLSFNFAASSVLARQIEEGAPADIFFSADSEKMEFLERKGLIRTASRKQLLSNQLVLVAPREASLEIHSPHDLLRYGVKRIALAEPFSVPLGIYSREYLTRLGIWKPLEPKVVPVANARAALATVESGNVDAGFVYRTDARGSRAVKVAYAVPRLEGPQIVYLAAVVRGSTRGDAAIRFLNFLRGSEAREIFRKYGFIPLKAAL